MATNKPKEIQLYALQDQRAFREAGRRQENNAEQDKVGYKIDLPTPAVPGFFYRTIQQQVRQEKCQSGAPSKRMRMESRSIGKYQANSLQTYRVHAYCAAAMAKRTNADCSSCIF